MKRMTSNTTTVNKYHINNDWVLMTGEYANYGKLCSRVMVGNTTFLVERSPLQILADSLDYIGLDLQGAKNGAKKILGERRIAPLIVNPYQDICVFSDKSMKCPTSIIFNLDQIEKTLPYDHKTKVTLKNGYTIIIDLRYHSFNAKMQLAQQLKQITATRGRQSKVFILDPKNKKEISKNKKGNYNFNTLIETEK
jgi:competence protein ComK